MISQCVPLFRVQCSAHHKISTTHPLGPTLHALNRISISWVRIVILWSLIKTPVGQNQNEILLYYEYSQEFAVGCLKLQSTVPRYRLGFMNIEIDTDSHTASLSSPDDKNIKICFRFEEDV